MRRPVVSYCGMNIAPAFQGRLESSAQRVFDSANAAANDLEELMICRLDNARKAVEPCSIIILGASGRPDGAEAHSGSISLI